MIIVDGKASHPPAGPQSTRPKDAMAQRGFSQAVLLGGVTLRTSAAVRRLGMLTPMECENAAPATSPGPMPEDHRRTQRLEFLQVSDLAVPVRPARFELTTF
jgi:hypothetical protein